MNLSPEDGRLFYKLYSALMFYANQKLQILDDIVADPKAYEALPPPSRIKVRDALFAHPVLMPEFVYINPFGFSEDERAIILTWKHALMGKFYVFRYLTKYTVFFSSGQSPNKAYGVLGLADPIEEVIGPYVPILVNAVLLPFKTNIIYDGLLSSYSISFGGGMKRMLNSEYKQAKKTFGIIMSLPEGNETPTRPKRPKEPRRPAVVKGRSSSPEVKDILDTLVQMTDAFCKQFLNEEYAEVCRKLANALARKRPSPLLQGKPETWACGIVRTIGWVNHLDDRSQKPHMKLPFIDKAFGVAESTGQGKSKLIRKMFKIANFDPKWTLPSKLAENPRVWMLEVNGFITDIRSAPRDLQMMAYQKGLIPYIPADQNGTNEED